LGIQPFFLDSEEDEKQDSILMFANWMKMRHLRLKILVVKVVALSVTTLVNIPYKNIKYNG